MIINGLDTCIVSLYKSSLCVHLCCTCAPTQQYWCMSRRYFVCAQRKTHVAVAKRHATNSLCPRNPVTRRPTDQQHEPQNNSTPTTRGVGLYYRERITYTVLMLYLPHLSTAHNLCLRKKRMCHIFGRLVWCCGCVFRRIRLCDVCDTR